jgi:hypothetical protein
MLIIPEKIVTLGSKTRAVIRCFIEALDGAGITQDAFVKASNKPSGFGSLLASLLPTGLEGAIVSLTSEKEYRLQRLDLQLDSVAENLCKEYEALWVNLLKLDGMTADELISDQVENSRLLIAEILIRLCADAVSINMNGDHDGDKLFLVMKTFINKICATKALITKGYIFQEITSTSSALATEHEIWMNWIDDMIASVKGLHANKNAVERAKIYVDGIKTILLRHLLAELTTEKHTKNVEASSFHERMLMTRLNNVENECIDEVLERPHLTSKKTAKRNVRQLMNYALASVNSNTSSVLKRQTGGDAREYFDALPEKRTRLIVKSIKQTYSVLLPTENKKLHVERLYELMKMADFLLDVLAEIADLNSTTGWIAIMFNFVELNKISNLIENYGNICAPHITISFDAPFFKTHHEIAVGLMLTKSTEGYSLANIGRSVATQLRELQTPACIQKILARIHTSFENLLLLEGRLNSEFKELASETTLVSESIRKNLDFKQVVIVESQAKPESNQAKNITSSNNKPSKTLFASIAYFFKPESHNKKKKVSKAKKDGVISEGLLEILESAFEKEGIKLSTLLSK